MTLRMNPLGFQLGVLGCVSPLLLVHRTISTCDPLPGAVKRICHWRKLYLPSSLPSWACCQGLPLARVSAPACSASPGLMLVMKERGTIRLSGTDLKPVCPGCTLACGVSGMVEGVFIQKLVWGWSSPSMSLSILTQ